MTVRSDDAIPRPTYGIVTALPKEFAAVKVMLDHTRSVAKGQRPIQQYVLGEVPSRFGGVHIVVLTMSTHQVVERSPDCATAIWQ